MSLNNKGNFLKCDYQVGFLCKFQCGFCVFLVRKTISVWFSASYFHSELSFTTSALICIMKKLKWKFRLTPVTFGLISDDWVLFHGKLTTFCYSFHVYLICTCIMHWNTVVSSPPPFQKYIAVLFLWQNRWMKVFGDLHSIKKHIFIWIN